MQQIGRKHGKNLIWYQKYIQAIKKQCAKGFGPVPNQRHRTAIQSR